MHNLHYWLRVVGATPVADFKRQPIRWLWPQRIPLGRITILTADPGLGKSLLTLDIAARVSSGAEWPDKKVEGLGSSVEGQQPNSGPQPSTLDPQPSSVLLLTAEDAIADTIRPRLEAMGADCDRIHAITHQQKEPLGFNLPGEPPPQPAHQLPFDLASDLHQLNEVLDVLKDCRLIIIDPLAAFLGAASENSNADVQ